MHAELLKYLRPRNTVTPRKGREHQFLNDFIGHWKIEGVNGGEDGKTTEPVTGDEVYEWLDREYFLVNKFDRKTERDRFTGLGWIGFDESSARYLSYSVSNLGYLRIYEVEISEHEIFYLGEYERGLIKLSPDKNRISVFWDRLGDDKKWKMLCDIKGFRLN